VTFEWGAAKSTRNLALRGFDVEFASLGFDATDVEFDDSRRDYGARRVIAPGLADGAPLTVVFTDRVESEKGILRRLVSARLSNRKERRPYAEAIEDSRSSDESA
jgi:uncharacterized protein